jgi:hypothetical protein
MRTKPFADGKLEIAKPKATKNANKAARSMTVNFLAAMAIAKKLQATSTSTIMALGRRGIRFAGFTPV